MKWTVGGLVAGFLMPVLFIAAAFGSVSPVPAPEVDWGGSPESLLEIPDAMLELYGQAAARFGVPMPVLAAVGKVECDHNRNPACARPNAAGAVGPMQFLPATFARYAGASGSPNPSILHPRDAVFAAAAKLAADGVAADPWAALYSYNHSDAYVAVVVGWAVPYGWAPGNHILTRTVLHHPNLSLRAPARTDLAAGRVDGRVLAALAVLANGYRLSEVGPFVSGHSIYVAGTDRISNHFLGRAVDLPVVDGMAVSPANRSARSLVTDLLLLPSALVPHEIGAPWEVDASGVDAFTADHADHIHLGYGPSEEWGLR